MPFCGKTNHADGCFHFKYHYLETCPALSSTSLGQTKLNVLNSSDKSNISALSLGQRDSQVVASSGKLNLRRDLRWVAKRTRKFPHKNTRVAQKPFQGRHILYFIGLFINWLGLGGQTVKNLRRLACKFDLDQSVRKSSQVNASARKPWPNGVASRPKFSTCVCLRVHLARA